MRGGSTISRKLGGSRSQGRSLTREAQLHLIISTSTYFPSHKIITSSPTWRTQKIAVWLALPRLPSSQHNKQKPAKARYVKRCRRVPVSLPRCENHRQILSAGARAKPMSICHPTTVSPANLLAIMLTSLLRHRSTSRW